jgi:RNA polymerase sigma-70 factor (ECF subfamily)
MVTSGNLWWLARVNVANQTNKIFPIFNPMSTDASAKQQKDKIFEEEFLPHIDSLFNFGFHLTYNEEDANDLVQETFMKAYRFIDSYQVGTNAKAWLFKILKNAFINDYRKKSKQPIKVDYEDVQNFQDADELKTVGSLDLREEVMKGMIGDEITNALNSLPVDFRTVILLCDIDGFTYEEIAKIVDIPIGTVRSRLHRARGLLKEQLKAYAQDLGYNEN